MGASSGKEPFFILFVTLFLSKDHVYLNANSAEANITH